MINRRPLKPLAALGAFGDLINVMRLQCPCRGAAARRLRGSRQRLLRPTPTRKSASWSPHPSFACSRPLATLAPLAALSSGWAPAAAFSPTRGPLNRNETFRLIKKSCPLARPRFLFGFLSFCSLSSDKSDVRSQNESFTIAHPLRNRL